MHVTSLAGLAVPITYDPTEYERWGEPGGSFVREVLCRLVTADEVALGRQVQTFLNQAAKDGDGYQHFPEVQLALHVVEKQKVPREAPLYENYYLSAAQRRSAKSDDGEKVKGAAWLDEVLLPSFFERFDELVVLNPPAQSREWLHLDLITRDDARKELKFWEAKKWNPGRAKSEELKPHQKAVLGILDHLFKNEPGIVFREPAWSGAVRLACLYARGDARPVVDSRPVRTRTTYSDED